jgi:predicted transcriptional regulator
MADYLREAIELVKAQAGTKDMTPEDTMRLVQQYQRSLLKLGEATNEELMAGDILREEQTIHVSEKGTAIQLAVNPDEALLKGQPEFITCAICGAQRKTLGRHLRAAHELTIKEYKGICGYSQQTKLTSRDYSQERQDQVEIYPFYRHSDQYRNRKSS